MGARLVSSAWLLTLCLISSSCNRSAGDYRLSRAAASGNQQVLAEYLDRGGDVNRLLSIRPRPPIKECLLHSAVRGAQPDTVDYLLRREADVDAQDWLGRTALMYAVGLTSHDQLETALAGMKMVDQLLKHGADLNLAEKDGTTPLMWASKYAPIVVAERLLRVGANVNATDARGYTALHEAKDAATALLLVRFGANVNARTVLGESPSEFALRQGRLEVHRALTQVESEREASNGRSAGLDGDRNGERHDRQ